jgi:hypothetical protein
MDQYYNMVQGSELAFRSNSYVCIIKIYIIFENNIFGHNSAELSFFLKKHCTRLVFLIHSVRLNYMAKN